MVIAADLAFRAPEKDKEVRGVVPILFPPHFLFTGCKILLPEVWAIVPATLAIVPAKPALFCDSSCMPPLGIEPSLPVREPAAKIIHLVLSSSSCKLMNLVNNIYLSRARQHASRRVPGACPAHDLARVPNLGPGDFDEAISPFAADDIASPPNIISCNLSIQWGDRPLRAFADRQGLAGSTPPWTPLGCLPGVVVLRCAKLN